MVLAVVEDIAYTIAIEEVDNHRDDLLKYWYFNHTKLFTGCSVFDENYVHKEWSKKKDWYGIAMLGPESSNMAKYLLPYY